LLLYWSNWNNWFRGGAVADAVVVVVDTTHWATRWWSSGMDCSCCCCGPFAIPMVLVLVLVQTYQSMDTANAERNADADAHVLDSLSALVASWD
jgi:hypothetical protein